MTNVDKLREAIADAGANKNKFMRVAREARLAGDVWKADMSIMDADFENETRMKLSGKLLDVLTRQVEIEAFEKRRGIEIDVMLYDVPPSGGLDEWWDFMNDETSVITDPVWQRS